MEQELGIKLEELQYRIQTEDISRNAISTNEWGGADVIIRSRLDNSAKKWLGSQPLVISFQNTTPRRRVVITKYSKELSWLFEQLRTIFCGKIDCITKFDFYGLLAQSANDYLWDNKKTEDVKALLLTVLNASKGFIQ